MENSNRVLNVHSLGSILAGTRCRDARDSANVRSSAVVALTLPSTQAWLGNCSFARQIPVLFRLYMAQARRLWHQTREMKIAVGGSDLRSHLSCSREFGSQYWRCFKCSNSFNATDSPATRYHRLDLNANVFS